MQIFRTENRNDEEEPAAEEDKLKRPVEKLKSHVWVGTEKRNVQRDYDFREARRALNSKIFVRNRITEFNDNAIPQDQFDKCMAVFERLASQKAAKSRN